MAKDCVEMNKYEKEKLIAKSKQAIRSEFIHIEQNDWGKYFHYINDDELLIAMSILLDAKKEKVQVKCTFDNHYIDSFDTHKFLIYGEERVPQSYDNVLAVIPSKEFKYFCEDEDITGAFVSCIDMLGVDSYSGKIIYSGIVNEESASEGFVDLNSTALINETEVYLIDELSPIWKKCFAESYRLYESEQYKLAFLHSFIGFESFIEYLNGILYNVYLKEQNDLLMSIFDNYNKAEWTPIDLIEKNVLNAESFQRLQHLRNENRGLIDDKLFNILRYVNDLETSAAERKLVDFKFFEKLRNVLAHGDSYEREDLKAIRVYQKYYDKSEKKMNFELIYRDFFIHIGNIIRELVK